MSDSIILGCPVHQPFGRISHDHEIGEFAESDRSRFRSARKFSLLRCGSSGGTPWAALSSTDRKSP